MIIFSGTSNKKLAEDVCSYIGMNLGNSVISHFPDGETMIKVEDNVRGKDCFIIQSTGDPVNQNIMELFIFIDCLKRSSANSITVVIPYYGYARQDRKTEGRTPITAKMVADLITNLGAERVLTIDLHSVQIEGFFNIPVDHLQAFPVFVNYFKQQNLDNYIVLSPDVGSMKRSNLYATELGLELSVIDKRRYSETETEAKRLVGDVKNKNVIMFDDMVSTAGTICKAAEKAKEEGAKKIVVAATHGLFSGRAYDNVINSKINEIIVSDTVQLSEKIKSLPNIDIKVISVSKLLGEAIVRIHDRRSVSVLLESNYENYMR